LREFGTAVLTAQYRFAARPGLTTPGLDDAMVVVSQLITDVLHRGDAALLVLPTRPLRRDRRGLIDPLRCLGVPAADDGDGIL
jgi:hypothetical protein